MTLSWLIGMTDDQLRGRLLLRQASLQISFRKGDVAAAQRKQLSLTQSISVKHPKLTTILLVTPALNGIWQILIGGRHRSNASVRAQDLNLPIKYPFSNGFIANLLCALRRHPECDANMLNVNTLRIYSSKLCDAF
jgi:hypothetical protein